MSSQSAVSPQYIFAPPAHPNRPNAADLGKLASANAPNVIKTPGGVVRDEEVVGSNPATPTHVISG